MSRAGAGTRPPYGWALFGGPVITLSLAILINLVARAPLHIPIPPEFFVLAIIFSTFLGGLRSGLISAAIAWAYTVYSFSQPGQPFQVTDGNLPRVIVWALVMPLTAFMVGLLNRRVSHAPAEAEVSAIRQPDREARALADEAPKISEQRLRALIDHTNDAIEVIDPETGRYLDVNENVCLDRDYYLAVVRDITERKRAEGLLAEQNQLLEMIARSAPLEDTLSTLVRLVESRFEGLLCSVLLLDADGQHIRHGAAPSLPEDYIRAIDGLAIGPRAGSCGTAMYRKEPVIVTDILQDPLWEDYRALADAHGLRACWSTPIMSHQECVLGSFAMYYREPRSPSPGEVRLIEVSTHLAGIAIERKRAERALIESHSLLRAVVEGASDAVFVKDLQGRYLMINSAGARFLGKTVEEVIGEDDRVLFTADTAGAIMEGDRQVIAAGESRMFERTATAAGVTRTFLSTKGVYRDAQGEVIGIFGISRDMTELKRLEDELRQAQKLEAIGRLAGGVAHDFNNLLTVINGCSELVFNRLCADDPGRELIAEIQKAGERAANLTRQLLAFSRKQVLQPQVVSLNTLLDELLKLLQRLIGEDIEVVLAPDATLGLAKVDPGQFEQACINLALNARDSMSEGGRLTIETYNSDLGVDDVEAHPEIEPGRYVVVAMSDTGQGMDQAVLARIFEPFFTTKGPGTGTGLGLAMVYGFVKQSGGHIGVSSERGHGTTFKVYLPRVVESTASIKSFPDNLMVPNGTETVLVVEDEDSVRGFVRLILESSGYTVLEARDGQEAISVAEQHQAPIHILLTDLVMPRTSGRQLADILAPTRPQMRVLFMSGYTDEAVVRHGVQEASVAFLQKPFDSNSLTRKIREVLDAEEARL